MTQVKKAIIYVEWHDRNREPKQIPVQYNPTEYTLDKSAQLAEVGIPGLDAPLQQFVRGQTEKLSLELFFDTTDLGTGTSATSVTTETDKIYQLIKIEPERHAPPILTFVWSDQFPGSSVGGAPGAAAAALGRAAAAAGAAVAGALGGSGASALATVSAGLGNQRRNGFRCVLESVRQKFTFFSPEGVPLRATLTVSFREYRTLGEQLERLNLSSPDRTHAHVVARGDSLASMAHRYYEAPGRWRPIADHNEIEDPRRLAIGRFVEVPKVE